MSNNHSSRILSAQSQEYLNSVVAILEEHDDPRIVDFSRRMRAMGKPPWPSFDQVIGIRRYTQFSSLTAKRNAALVQFVLKHFPNKTNNDRARAVDLVFKRYEGGRWKLDLKNGIYPQEGINADIASILLLGHRIRPGYEDLRKIFSGIGG